MSEFDLMMRLLMRELRDCGAKVTFSAHCRSGIVGRDGCICWRCRGESGPADDESRARRRAQAIDRLRRMRLRK